MKIVSTIINPIPDEEGYHIFECDKCQELFSIKPQDIEKQENLYCPYCGHQGSFITFTNNIRKKVYKDHPIISDKESNENQEIDLEHIKEMLKDLKKDDMDIELLEYSVEEIIHQEELIKYEFICCDKMIKVPMEIFKHVKYCTFCKGEILFNMTE